MTRRRLRTATVLVGASLTIMTAAAPAALAGSARAVDATWHVAPGYYNLAAGLGAMWVVRSDESHSTLIYRIDPTSNTQTFVARLPFPGSGVVIAYGSLWIADYFGNSVHRVAPDGTDTATIQVGLQPQWMDAAFGSLWVSNHHSGSISRIDPRTNTVVATVPVGARHTFRNGPQAITHDATRMYVGSSNLPRLQSVDPATNSVTTSPATSPDEFCQTLDAVGGAVWSLDTNCSGAIYLFDLSGAPLTAFTPPTGFAESLTDLRGTIWLGVARSFDPNTGIGAESILEQRDASTGALLRTVRIGGDANLLGAGFGAIWVFDANKYTVRRVNV